MKKLFAFMTIALILLVGSPVGAADTTRADKWRAIAVQALALYDSEPAPTSFAPFVHANAMLAIGRLYGWDDPRVTGLLVQLMAERNPDGGWGIGIERNGLSGGTNPPDTTYTVTLAGHVGPALLAAWKAGALTDPEPLRTITTLLMTTQRVTSSKGQCVIYSRSSNDAGHCVHNVNAGVADYLTQANAAGFGKSGLQKLVVDITRYEVDAYNPTWAGWPYKDAQSTEQDPDHGSYMAQSLYFLTYPVGREAVYQGMVEPATADDGRRAHLKLVATPGGPGSQAINGEDTTLWCTLGDQYLAEITAYVNDPARSVQDLAAASAAAASNSTAC